MPASTQLDAPDLVSAAPEGGPAPTLPGGADAPSPTTVARLQGVRGYPCVSLLMTTTPAARMTTGDATRLRHLAAQAFARLQAEDLDAGIRPVLNGLVADAAAGPTGAGVAVFAGPAEGGTAEVVTLPVPVRDRVVVDPSFATRDLVRALHRTPRHVVLVLSASEARLFDGVAGSLRPAARSAFPVVSGAPATADAAQEAASGSRRPGRRATGRTGGRSNGHTGTTQAELVAHLRRVDRALGTYLQLHPAPVVLVGPERLLATYRGLSRHLARLAGSITGSHVRLPLPDLARRIGPVLDAYLHSREHEALEILQSRRKAGRVVSGMPSVWPAARRGRPEMLAVEDTLFYPARLDEGGDLLLPADDVEHPDVLDDAVDELIELVLDRGGWVALVRHGSLAGHDRVALTLRP